MKRRVVPSLAEVPEELRAEAYRRYEVIRPCLEKEVSQAEQARISGVAQSTVERWMKQYRQDGLRGLVRQERADKGTRRRLSEEVVKLVEGFALHKPQRSIATIQRQVSAIALQNGWEEPSYRQVYEIVRGLPQALVTLAHEGTRAYQEEYDLLYRREAERPNEIWQADYCLLPILVKDSQGKSARPWLTVIEDDRSRAIAGYRLSWSAPSAIQTALTLRLAIWRKEDVRWQVCGIPEVFYTDHGSDFTSVHLEQVGADLKMQLVFSQVGRPRGRGKIERFFQSVEQLLLEQLPGYAPKEAWPQAGGEKQAEPRAAVLTLGELEQRFRTWLLEEYHRRVQKGQSKGPQERWEEGGFLPRMPESLEQLDLLLVQVARKRRIQQSGIAFEGYTYIDPTLAAYVGEEVQIRYDPLDLAELRVYFEDRFVCRAICPELSGQTVSLKEIEAARRARRKHLRGELESRETLVKRYLQGSLAGSRTAASGGEAGKDRPQEAVASTLAQKEEERRERLQEEVAAPTLVPEEEAEARPSARRLRRYRDE